MDFDHAQANFYAAARDGLAARFTWLDGEEVIAQPFILERLLPLAEAGLARAGVDAPTRQNVPRHHRGARAHAPHRRRWALRSLAEHGGRAARRARGARASPPAIARQETDAPVAEWERARLDEAPARSTGYTRSRSTCRPTSSPCSPDDPIELVADLMSWERIRHVPVEDDDGKLVGLVSLRAIIRHLAKNTRRRCRPSSRCRWRPWPRLAAAALHLGRLAAGRSVGLPDAAYLHLFVTRGEVVLEGAGPLLEGDAARLAGAGGVRVTATTEAELLAWEMQPG